VISILAVPNAGIIVLACTVFVVITGFMVFVALTWAKHGMFPTKGLAAGLASRSPFIRRRFERWNREAGWGDMGDDQTRTKIDP
jgi:hypothetical protein